MQDTVTKARIQEFVDNLLAFEMELPAANKRSPLELATAINTILTSRQYITQRPNEQLKTRLLKKVEQSIIAQEPIHLIVATGGFKNHHSATWPHIDWAEVFAVRLLIDIALRIHALYRPGVILEFTGDSYAMSFCNNIPMSAIDTYAADFEGLLRVYQAHLPEGIKLVQKNIEAFYSLDELIHRMSERADVQIDEATLRDYEDQYLQKAANNFMTAGTEDYSHLTQADLKPLLMRSILLDRAWINIDMTDRLEYLEGGNRIPIIHTSSPGSIMLKSVKTRKLAFWLGTGLLRIDDKRIIPDIIHASKFGNVSEVKDIQVVSPFTTIPSLQTIPHTAESWLP